MVLVTVIFEGEGDKDIIDDDSDRDGEGGRKVCDCTLYGPV